MSSRSDTSHDTGASASADEKSSASAPQVERETPQETHSRSSSDGCMIVGIGASAGGLEAFRKFFSHMPADCDLAFVLVQHLAPDHPSVLAELLDRTADMPVVEAEDGMRVEQRHVYVIPPDATLTIVDGCLKVEKPAPPRENRWPINTFFTSLAQDQADCSVCIVLAGTGSDGAKGLRAVKDHGGLALAQSGFDHVAMTGMPASAAATGLVDSVLPVEDMPERLLAHQRQMKMVQQRTDADGVREDLGKRLKTICELLYAETGHDFSQYKQKTLLRRIQRRMLVVQADTEADYVDYLRNHSEEHQLLFHEFLIGVTEFFRDPEALDVLSAVAIPAILENKANNERIRIWVPGCASGEEVYSIAMLLSEQMEEDERGPKAQIFATDIDDRAINAARAGRYRSPLTGISPERRERWFTRENGEYCVDKQIRDMCIFSAHNVTRDPPFSRIDLISCRNLLIYLNADLQRRLVQSFHYALRSGGFLLLGASERLTHDSNLFKQMHKKQRLYVRREVRQTRPRDLSSAQRPPVDHASHHTPPPTTRSAEDRIERYAREMLEPYSPAYVIINARHEVLRFGGDTGRYLAPSSGAASLNLFQLLGRPLRAVVREAVLQVCAGGKGLIREGLSFSSHGQDRPLRLIVEPLPGGDDAAAAMCVVAFSEIEYAQRPTEDAGKIAPGGERARIRELEKELRSTRSQLNVAVDMHERTSEELKSANEEYQSVNEELQSANEELETSTEEMQSINEELQTVNVELNSKNEELNQVNNDISNLLDSTHIAAVFLDKELTIRNFTPDTTEVFHLREGDKGRPLPEIAPRIDYPQLKEDAALVLEKMEVTERVLHGINGRSAFLMRMRPYVTGSDAVDGVVMTFVDVTHTQRRARDARLAAIVNSSRDAIVGFSLDDSISSWNPAAERIFGFSAEQAMGQPLSMLRPSEPTEATRAFFDSTRPEQRLAEFEMMWVPSEGEPVPLEISYSPVRDDDGTLIAGKLMARDITERRRAEKHTRMMLAELNHRVKNTLASVQAIAYQTLAISPDMEAFRESFLSRLLALSQTHNLLAQGEWNGASLTALIENELAPYQRDDGRVHVTLEGDDITLAPKQALALSMGLHELATNAGKYGALSEADGQVAVKWWTRTVGEWERLHLQWTETGGPAVSPPKKRGFGSRLIDEGLTYELGGEVDLQFPSSGVTCRIEIPLR